MARREHEILFDLAACWANASLGQPTFEGTRPTGRFPTRSGLLGLLGACLGIQRDDTSSLQALSESVHRQCAAMNSFLTIVVCL